MASFSVADRVIGSAGNGLCAGQCSWNSAGQDTPMLHALHIAVSGRFRVSAVTLRRTRYKLKSHQYYDIRTEGIVRLLFDDGDE